MKLTIRRKGGFSMVRTGQHKCGPDGFSTYDYHATIVVDGDVGAPDYFIVDNDAIHDYFVRTWTKGKEAPESCERMAQRGVVALRRMMLLRQDAGAPFELVSVTVSITGNKGISELEASWTAPGW